MNNSAIFCNFLSFQGEGQVVFVLISSQISCWAEVFQKSWGNRKWGCFLLPSAMGMTGLGRAQLTLVPADRGVTRPAG